MAKQSASYLGGFSGRLGTAVGYMWNGKWCVRVHQPYVHNPRTKAQVEHRELFKQEVQLAAKMRRAVTKTMTSLAREAGMTSYNLFVKANQHAFSAVEGQLQVDYSQLRMSIGEVAPVECKEMAWTEDNVLTVKFRPGHGRSLDYVYLYVYVPDCGEGFITAPVYRYDRKITFRVSDYYAGHEAQVYLMAMSEEGRWSESLYCGAINQGEESNEQRNEENGKRKEENGKREKENVTARHNTNRETGVIEAENPDNHQTDCRCRTSMS